jgi:hypothetical protein
MHDNASFADIKDPIINEDIILKIEWRIGVTYCMHAQLLGLDKKSYWLHGRHTNYIFPDSIELIKLLYAWNWAIYKREAVI